MLKLTGHLFCWQPKSRLADYYERALYNDILGSQNPSTAMMLYFEPLRMGGRKQYSDSFNTFTCCVGSGMENHSKYAEDIYFEGVDGSLYVNLFIPSKLTWKDKKMTITQNTAYPENGIVSLTMNTTAPTAFSVRIRQPCWATKGATLRVNQKEVKVQKDSAGYWVINRLWKNSDRIEVNFPMDLYTEAMPDNKNRVAVLYGPVVLAGNLGDTLPDPVYGTPVLLTDNHNVHDWAVPVKQQPLTFLTTGIGKPFDVTLTPFYKNVENYYSVYWDFFTNEDWTTRQQEYAAEKKAQQQIEAHTIDVMRLGEMQPERDHDLHASEQSYASDAYGRTGREVRNNGFFSFKMKVEPNQSVALLCTYLGDDKNRTFDILVDDVKIASEELKGGTTGKFFNKEYPLPAELTKNKNTIVVRVQATNGRTAGRMFGCRTIRK